MEERTETGGKLELWSAYFTHILSSSLFGGGQKRRLHLGVRSLPAASFFRLLIADLDVVLTSDLLLTFDFGRKYSINSCDLA